MDAALPGIAREAFGTMPDGRPVERLTLRGGGIAASIITYGAAVQALHVPDRDGRLADVVLGADDMAGYLDERRCFGAAIGRYANRIAGGRFSLDGKAYAIAPNDGPNALHGGSCGFDTRLWTVEVADATAESSRVVLTLDVADGGDGFPGAARVRLTYRISGPGELEMAFEAVSDRPTLMNLTGHGYFNLAGVEQPGDILGHRLAIPADSFLPIDAHSIPQGDPLPVAGTPFDFRAAAAIGARIGDEDGQLHRTGGYDHNYCLEAADDARVVARVEEPRSGRTLEIASDQPGVQFYSGQFLNGTARGKYGQTYARNAGFCLEPQLWPDSPNRPDFPSARLEAGQVYHHRILYRFGTA